MAEAQTSMDQPDLYDLIIAFLGAWLFGAIIGTVVFGLIAGYEYAASEFLNIYPPDDATAEQTIRVVYALSPWLLGALATIPAFRFLMQLK